MNQCEKNLMSDKINPITCVLSYFKFNSFIMISMKIKPSQSYNTLYSFERQTIIFQSLCDLYVSFSKMHVIKNLIKTTPVSQHVRRHDIVFCWDLSAVQLVYNLVQSLYPGQSLHLKICDSAFYY